MDNNRPYVFISYAHVNSDIVFPCIEAMKKEGVNLWFDEGIEAGSEWSEFIAQKVVECSKFVLFVSNAYLQSQNCKRELNFAISRKKDILSVFIEDAALSPGMEMQLGTYQALYRKRFDEDGQFCASLAQEHYFDGCRFEKPAGNEPAAQKSESIPRSVPSGIPYVQNNSNVQNNTNVQSDAPSQSGSTLTDKVDSISKSVSDSINNFFDNIKGGSDSNQNTNINTANKPKKSRIIAVLLALFFGSFGIQKFYLGQTKLGIVYAVLFFTYIPFFLSMIELFMLIFSSNEKLKARYGFEFTN